MSNQSYFYCFNRGGPEVTNPLVLLHTMKFFVAQKYVTELLVLKVTSSNLLILNSALVRTRLARRSVEVQKYPSASTLHFLYKHLRKKILNSTYVLNISILSLHILLCGKSKKLHWDCSGTMI